MLQRRPDGGFNYQTPQRNAKQYMSSPLARDNNGMPLEVLDRLKTFPLFRCAPEAFFTSICAKVRPLFVGPQQYIITEGEQAMAAYWIIRGSVNVTSRDGESLYAELKEGAFFGEIGILLNQPRTATIISRTRCLLVVLTAEALRSELPNFPTVDKAIRDEAQERLQLLRQKKQITPKVAQLVDSGLLNIRESLQSLTIFQELPSDLLHVLGLSVTTRTYGPFSSIFVQGSSGRDIHFILSGTVEVVDETSKQVRATLGRSQYFGEFAWLSLAPQRTATVRAVTQVELLVLGEDALSEISTKYPKVRASIEETAKKRMAGSLPLSGGQVCACEVEPSDPDPFFPEQLPALERMLASAKQGEESPVSRKRSLQLTDIPLSKRLKDDSPSKPAFVLSDDIYIRIFSSLSLPDLMRMRQVSSHWSALLTTSLELLNVLDLRPYSSRLTDNVLTNISIFAGSRPQVVDISNCFHITDEGFSALVTYVAPNVKILNMKSVWEVSCRKIIELSQRAEKLEELDLSNCRKLNDSTAASILGIHVPKAAGNAVTAEQLRGLRKLTISHCKHISDYTMSFMATHAANRLEELNLTRCTTITDYGFQVWGSTRFPNLTKINLADCTFLTDNSMVYLSNAATSLKYLDLSFCCALSDTAVEVLSLGCSSLTFLRLAFCGSAVSDTSLRAVGLHLSELKDLSVRGCVRVTPIGVEAVVNGCGKLKTFDVSQCKNLQTWIASDGADRSQEALGRRIQFIC